MRGKGTLQPCSSSSLLLSFSSHSSLSLAKLRMLAHPQATIRTMAMGLRWIMSVLHNGMLVVHVFQASKIKDNNQGTRDRDIVIANLRR